MSAFQVALGLLLLSVSAATSLAEERVRGSLDILLSTPMSTRSILAGKWWGTFRQIGPVLFWPELFSFWLLLDTARWVHFLLLIGTILGYGAADHQPGPGAGDLGEPPGPGGRAVHHRVRGVLDRLADPDRRPVQAGPPGAEPAHGLPGHRHLMPPSP